MAEIKLEGLDQIKARLAFMQDPRGMQAGLEAAANDIRNIAKVYPPYKHVTMKQAGGWKSDKQRKYVMAKIREGSIIPGKSRRSNKLRDNWKIKVNKLSAQVHNQSTYGPYVQGGGDDQSRMHDLIGWKTVETIADEQTERVVATIMKVVNRILSGG